MYIENRPTADTKLIYDFIRNKKILAIKRETKSLLPPVLDIILSYADMPSAPCSHSSLIGKYRKQLVEQQFLTDQEADELDKRLAKSNNDSREYAILFETHERLARAFRYRQFPRFETRIMPLLQNLPRADAKLEPETDRPGDKWSDDRSFTFFRWVCQRGFISIFHDLLATRFYQDSNHLHAALRFGGNQSLQAAILGGITEIVEVLLQNNVYQELENIQQALYSYQFGHFVLKDVCISGSAAIFEMLIKTPFYQDQNNLAEALQVGTDSIFYLTCCNGTDSTIVEMLLATEFYQSGDNLRAELENNEHVVLRDTFASGKLGPIKLLLNTSYYQNHDNLNIPLVASHHYILRHACMSEREAIVRLLLETDFYQNPHNLHDALTYRSHQALGETCRCGNLGIMKILLNTTFYQNEANFADFLQYHRALLLRHVSPSTSDNDLDNASSAEILQLVRHQQWSTTGSASNAQCETETQSDTKEEVSSTTWSKRRSPLSVLFTSPLQHMRHNQTAAGQSHPIGDLESFQLDEPESSESPRHNAAG